MRAFEPFALQHLGEALGKATLTTCSFTKALLLQSLVDSDSQPVASTRKLRVTPSTPACDGAVAAAVSLRSLEVPGAAA